MSDLPDGWAVVTLADLIAHDGVFTDGDWVETKDQDPSGEVRLTQLADVGEGLFRDRSSRFLRMDQAERLHCTFLRTGDVLVARMPDPLGRACLVPELGQPAVTAVDVCIVRPGSPSVEPRWLMWAINAPEFRRAVANRQTGTTRKRISRKNLAAIPFPVPPLAEQRRIVAAIEEQVARIVAGEASLAAAASRLTGLRSALLESRTEYATSKPLREFAQIFVGTTPSRSRSELWDGDVPGLKRRGVVPADLFDPETIASEATQTDRIHPPGTVLLAMIGEGKTRGQAAILDVAATHNQNSAAMRLDPDQCVPEWLFYVLMARYHETRRAGSGGQQPALNRDRVGSLMIPLPPLEHQREAVAEIEQQLSIVDSLSAAVESVQKRDEALRRAILERAFRGELVPQDSDDEPASVLLERIRAERAAAPKPSRRKRVTA